MLKYGSGEGANIWEGLFYTDQNPDGSVFDMYSNETRYFNGFNGIDGMHIEHSLPNSWWGGIKNNAYKDLYRLCPADATMNMSKSNNPLGEVSGTPIQRQRIEQNGEKRFRETHTQATASNRQIFIKGISPVLISTLLRHTKTMLLSGIAR